MRKNRLKQLWREDKPTYGIWTDFGSPAVVEAMTQLGDLDWVLLDGEHGIASYEGCYPMLQAMNGSKATSIIRVPWNDSVAIKRSLDMGAEGILVPYIKTAEEVKSIVAACRYPPIGCRGLGPYRAARYETDFQDYYACANDEIAVIVQIENREAVENLEAILGVPGLDAIFIGPADLSASLGHFPNMNAPEVQKVVDHILQSARAKKIPAGYYCNSGKDARARADQGFRMMNVGNDMVFLVNALRRELKAARE